MDVREAAGDLLPQLHHPSVSLRQVVGEWNPGIGEEAKHVLLVCAETQQQVLADTSRWPTSRSGLGQRGLRFMECQAIGDNGVITAFDQGNQPRLQWHILLACEVHDMAGTPQQPLHPARPVLLLDLDQGLQFTQVVRIAQRMQHAGQRYKASNGHARRCP